MSQTEYALRKTAIHLLRSGKTPTEVAQELNRSRVWVDKWRERFFAQGDWQALQDQSRAPDHPLQKLSEAVRQARSQLEAEAAEPGKLSYIDAHAVSARLRRKKITSLPSISSIERELRAAGMTRPYRPRETVEVLYPHLHPARPLQLIQVDSVPHYLPGGACVSCFNAIDVVSGYPSGQPSLTRGSQDAVSFLLHVWREIGIPEFTQVDNEGCFSGGLGKVLRLALLVGTRLLFSPHYHPESNGAVERFPQDYTQPVCNKLELPNVQAVQQQSPGFFAAYRHSEHHSALQGRCPADLHPAPPVSRLPVDFHPPHPLPLTSGQVHFLRRVSQASQVSILNLDWSVPLAQPDQAVWATLEFRLEGANLRIYDTAPDVQVRTCLAEHPFPLKGEVLPLADEFQRPVEVRWPAFLGYVADSAIRRFFGRVLARL